MKSYELKPTYENLLDTMINDSIGRNNDIHRFAEILNTLEDSCSIAVDGKWGSGKTFFVKQTKLFLDAHNEYINFKDENAKSSIKTIFKEDSIEWQPQVSVYYDAWENDNDREPVLSLIYSIIENIDNDFTMNDNEDCFKIAASLMEIFTGKDEKEIINNFNSKNPLDEIRKTKDIEVLIKDFLNSLLTKRGKRLIVFIDELDRCNPCFAVNLLERIKHYFYDEHITFVFSINTQELQHTIKHFYGETFDAYRYLNRFFDLKISMPPADKNKFYQNINFNSQHYTYDFVCSTIIEFFDLQLREITKYILMTKMAAYKPTHENGTFNFSFSNGKAKQFCLTYLVPIMIGLKIYNIDLYNKFISGKDVSLFIEIMKRIEYHDFNSYLNNDETFEEKDNKNNKKLVTFDDKLKQIYESVFSTVYSGTHYRTLIGKYEFEAGIKEDLIRTISMLSKYASLDVD